MYMSYIPTSLITIYQARLDAWEALLVEALAYYEFLLGTEGTSSFKFDSGEASSWARYTEPEKFQKVITSIESQIDYYRNKVNGTGIVRLNQSRGR
jgi:hypothetical protein